MYSKLVFWKYYVEVGEVANCLLACLLNMRIKAKATLLERCSGWIHSQMLRVPGVFRRPGENVTRIEAWPAASLSTVPCCALSYSR